MSTTLLLILIITYGLSVYRNWIFISLCHYHPHGIFYNVVKENFGDILLTLCPIVNTVFSLFTLFISWKDSSHQTKKYFFKPKKPYKVD